MKKIINEEGFKKAMDAGETWTVLDCQLSGIEDGRYYWEIEKTEFYGESPNWLKKGKDAKTEMLAYGEDDDSFKVVSKIWDNFIEKHTPDEYFVDQHELVN